MISSKRNHGNALVEFVVLLTPIYVLVVVGLIYMGDLTDIRMRLQPAVELASARPDTTNAATLQQQLFSGYKGGKLTTAEDTREPFPARGRTRAIIDELVSPGGKAYANVSFEFRNGELVPVLSTGVSSRPPELPPNYLENNLPELIEDTLLGDGRGNPMQGYAAKVAVQAKYEYDPGYIRVGMVNLASQAFTSKHTSLIRGTMQRESEGVGTGHPIEKLVNNPDFPDGPMGAFNFMKYDRELWLPDKGATKP